MKRVMCLAVVAMMVMALMITGCTKKEEPVTTIKVGVAGPHSGDLASYGIPTVRAAEMVVEEINAKGGVLGRRLGINHSNVSRCPLCQ